MKTAIIFNSSRSGAEEFTGRAIDKIASLGGRVLMTEDMKSKFSSYDKIEYFSSDRDMMRECDIALAVGGDGTIINAAKKAAQENKPLLGVNFGRIGFVAQLEPYEEERLDEIISGRYKTEERMMLKAELIPAQGEPSVYCALNDIVVSRGSFSRIVDFSIGRGEREICSYRADGLIFSTPTGSTAYSLSAGGPVVEPTMSCIVFTPVCSHSLFSRPVIFSAESVLSLSAGCDDDSEVYLTVDGRRAKRLERGDTVKISKSDFPARLIVASEKTFYQVLGEKLNRRTE